MVEQGYFSSWGLYIRHIFLIVFVSSGIGSCLGADSNRVQSDHSQ